MAFVEKREGRRGTSWRARVRDPLTGELVSETFPTRAAATEWLHDQESAKNDGRWRDRAAGKVLFGAVVEGFIDSAVDLAPATIALYRGMYRNHIAGTA